MAQFTCAACHETFDVDEDWTEEDKIAEYGETFGDRPLVDVDVVCDDCYPKILGWAQDKGLIAPAN
jgi:hypothetical protein